MGTVYFLGPLLIPPVARVWPRYLVFATVWLLVARYLDWRLFSTVVPANGAWYEIGWIWFCFAVELVDCTFTGRLRKAIFNGTVPAEQRSMAGRISNDFRGNDFSGMDLRDVGFRTGIDLTLQRLPTGSQYLYVEDATGAVHRARNAVAHWEDLALRREAMVLIEILESEISEGQRQLLLRKDDYSSFPGEAIDALFGLLGGG